MKKIFISYSQKDKSWKDKLLKHLKILDDYCETWSDGEIPMGGDWWGELEVAINECDVAVLLISPDFLNSDFIKKHELPAILKRNKRDNILIVPIIISPCFWTINEQLSAIQTPQTSKSLIGLSESEVEVELFTITQNLFGRLGFDTSKKKKLAIKTVHNLQIPVPYVKRKDVDEDIYSAIIGDFRIVEVTGISGIGKTWSVENALFKIIKENRFDYVIKIAPNGNTNLNSLLNDISEVVGLGDVRTKDFSEKLNTLSVFFKEYSSLIFIDSYERIYYNGEIQNLISNLPFQTRLIITSTISKEFHNAAFIHIEKIKSNKIRAFVGELITRKFLSVNTKMLITWDLFDKVTKGIPHAISKVLYLICIEKIPLKEIESKLKHSYNYMKHEGVTEYIWVNHLSDLGKNIVKYLSAARCQIAPAALKFHLHKTSKAIEFEIENLEKINFISVIRKNELVYFEVQDPVANFVHSTFFRKSEKYNEYNSYINSIIDYSSVLIGKYGGIDNYKGFTELHKNWELINTAINFISSRNDDKRSLVFWSKLEYYLHYSGLYQRRVELGEIACKAALRLKDKHQYGKILVEISESYWYLYCNKDETLKKLKRGINILEKSHDKIASGFGYYYQARIYRQIKEYDLANKNLVKSLDIGIKNNSDQLVAYVLNNLGNLSVEKKDFSNALTYYFDSIKLWEKLSDKLMIGIVYRNIIKVLAQDNDVVACEEYYNKAMLIFQKYGVNTEISQLMLEVANIYINNNLKSKAKRMTSEAKKFFQKVNSLHYLRIVNNLELKISKME